MKTRLVMIGNGMAGIRCIEEILKQNDTLYDITIFGDEPHPNYNRIMLSHVLQGKTNMLDIIMNEYSWYEENDITLYTNEKVLQIDRKERVIVTERNRLVMYDKLIIATGSSAFILPVEGANLPGVTGFRTIEDTQFMMDTAKQYKKAVVIGGGLLGLEAARGLIDLGMDVHVVHLASHLMEQQLDAKEALMKYGLFSEQASFSTKSTVYLRRNINRIAVIQEKIGPGSYIMTHEYKIDHRFDEIHTRMLSEFTWDSIVFEGRAAIDTFIAEVKRLGFTHIFNLPFSYTDELTLQYANKVGFQNIDYELQAIFNEREVAAK